MAKTIPAPNPFISVLDFRVTIDLVTGKFNFDMGGSVITDASGITSVSFEVETPNGNKIGSNGPAFTSTNIGTVFQLSIPKLPTGFYWGYYSFKAILKIGTTTYESVKEKFNMCAIDEKKANAVEGQSVLQLTVNCQKAKVRLSGLNGNVYQGKTPTLEQKNVTFYYPPQSELTPVKNISSLPAEFDARIGKNEARGANISTYEFPDQIKVIIKWVGTASKSVRCNVNYSKLVEAYQEYIANINCSDGSQNVDCCELARLANLAVIIQWGLNSGTDVDKEIEEFQDIIGVDCSCGGCDGDPVQPEPITCPAVQSLEATVVGFNLNIKYNTAGLPQGAQLTVEYRSKLQSPTGPWQQLQPNPVATGSTLSHNIAIAISTKYEVRVTTLCGTNQSFPVTVDSNEPPAGNCVDIVGVIGDFGPGNPPVTTIPPVQTTQPPVTPTTQTPVPTTQGPNPTTQPPTPTTQGGGGNPTTQVQTTQPPAPTTVPNGQQFQVFSGWYAQDPLPALQGGDGLTYQNSGMFVAGQEITADFRTAGADKWYVLKVHTSLPVPDRWYDTAFNYGTVPDQAFREAFTVGSFNYIVSRNSLAFDPTQLTKFSRIAPVQPTTTPPVQPTTQVPATTILPLTTLPATTLNPQAVAPDQISNMWAWFKGGNGVNLVSGGVDSWLDQSGNERHFVKSATGARPAYVTATNNQRAIRFTAASQQNLVGATIPDSSDFTILVVGTLPVNQGRDGYPNGWALNFPHSEGKVALTLRSGGAASYYSTDSIANNIMVRGITFKNDQTNGAKLRLFYNDLFISQDAMPKSLLRTSTIGLSLGKANTDSEWQSGDIYQLVIYDKTLTDAEMISVMKYLNIQFATQQPTTAPGATTIPVTTVAPTTQAPTVPVTTLPGQTTTPPTTAGGIPPVAPNQMGASQWYRTDQGLITNGGVQTWEDLIGNFDMISVSAGVRPSVSTGVNGKLRVNFNGSTQWLRNTYVGGSVQAPITHESDMTYFSMGTLPLGRGMDGDGAWNLVLAGGDGISRVVMVNNSGFQYDSTVALNMGVESFKIFVIKNDIANNQSSLTIWENGIKRETLQIQNSRLRHSDIQLTLGRYIDQNTYDDGGIYEFGGFNRVLSDSECQQLSAYAAAYYGGSGFTTQAIVTTAPGPTSPVTTLPPNTTVAVTTSPSASAQSPSDLDANMWFRSDLGVTNSGGVSQWLDQVGNYHFINLEASDRPQVQSGSNGQNKFVFNGTGNYLRSPNPGFADIPIGDEDSFTIMTVGSTILARGLDTFGNGWSLALNNGLGESVMVLMNQSGQDYHLDYASTPGTERVRIWTFLNDIGGNQSVLKLYENGLLKESKTFANSRLRQSDIGLLLGAGYQPGIFDTGSIYEVAGWNSILTDQQIQNLNLYAMQRYFPVA